jgi:hypothetical protein
MRGPRFGGRAPALLVAGLLLLAAGSAAQDPCGVPADSDRLKDLADAVDLVDPLPLSRKARRGLDSARASLADRQLGTLGGARSLAPAAKGLEKAGLLAPVVGAALDALRVDHAADRAALDPILQALPAKKAASVRRRLDAYAARVSFQATAGRLAKAAGFLLKGARLVDLVRNPPVPEYGGPLRVLAVSVGGLSLNPLNDPVVVQFSASVDPSTVRADTIQIRQGPNYGLQAPGRYEVRGPLVTFFPRLPVRADLADCGVLPSSNYRVTIPGLPSSTTVRAAKGLDPVAQTTRWDWSTATDPSLYFSTRPYRDPPPPRVACTTPADLLPAAPWNSPGGATGVPVDAAIVLSFNRVPLLPALLTEETVTLTLTDFRGTPVRRRIPGSVSLAQDEGSVRVSFTPRVRLPDRSRFVLQVASTVADLTGVHGVPSHEGRAAIRAAAVAATVTDPGGPLAALFRDHPLEIDPRTYLVFTTRDEPAEDREVALEFDGNDRDVDGGPGVIPALTTASFNDRVPGAVASVITVAGGDGRLGDFHPTSDTVLDTDSPDAPGGVFHFRSITIPRLVNVTVTGSRPAILRSQRDVTIEWFLLARGGTGDAAEPSYTSALLAIRRGGAAGPGGGAGGDASTNPAYALPGASGEQGSGNGGVGGGGGYETTSSDLYSFAGGGGGGGHAAAGGPGFAGTYPPAGHPYNGAGGSAGSPSTAGEPDSASTSGGRTMAGFTGGGGGAGGNNHITAYGWRTTGAGGGGGGGSLLITTAGDMVVKGTVDARGGDGGPIAPANSLYGGAAGGGGAGGAIALYAEGKMDVTGAMLLATGGAGGLNGGGLYLGTPGAGSDGFVRLEDGDGVIAGVGGISQVPTPGTGEFQLRSEAGDPPSIFTGNWFGVGAVQPRFLPAVDADFLEQNLPGCSIRWELQAAAEDPNRPGFPDLGSLDPGTGATNDDARASGWLLLRDTAGGTRDLTPLLAGRAYDYFRVRITFTLAEGLASADPKPAAGRFRLRLRYQE